MTNNPVNPNYQIFEDELQNHPLIKDKIQEKINKRKFSTPIAINKEKHSVEQATKAKEYDNLVANFPDNKIPPNFKELWQSLNNRPNITQEEYNNLKNSQKPTDYDQIKGELSKWTSTFPNLEPSVVKVKYDQLPSTELSETEKEAIREYQAVKNERDTLKNKVSELEKRPTPEELAQVNGKLKEWTDKFGDKKPDEVLAKYNEPKGKELTKEEQEKLNTYDALKNERDQTKGDLAKWTSIFPGLEPITIKDKITNLENDKLNLQNQINASHINPDGLKLLLKENWEEVWNHIDNLTNIIKRAIVVSKPDLSSEGDSSVNKPPINNEKPKKPNESSNTSQSVSDNISQNKPKDSKDEFSNPDQISQ